jgi:Leucine-rich repeat (LRR) protein
MHDPAFPQWLAQVQAMPAEEQVKAVSKKLMELNPRFDGKLTGSTGNEEPKVEDGVVTSIGFLTKDVTDISPVRALVGLKTLRCQNSPVDSALSNLSPLQGMPLISLDCGYTGVSDLTPLQGMPLTSLVVQHTRITDLSPLKGMPLTVLKMRYSERVSDLLPLAGMPLVTLDLAGTGVTDLSPLQGMPLANLECGAAGITDLSPLKELPLKQLICTGSQVSDLVPLMDQKGLVYLNLSRTNVTAAAVAALQKALPDCKIEWDDPAKATTPQPAASSKLFMHDPAFPQWMAQVQAMPAEEQIQAVSKKLMELNPGFDGNLQAPGKTSPVVEDGVVTEIAFSSPLVRDISPLRALSGLRNIGCGCPLTTPGILADLSPLEGLPLGTIWCQFTQVSDLSPLKGMKQLRNLNCYGTPIVDLSPLHGLPLISLACFKTQVADVEPLSKMDLLRSLDIKETKVTATQVAALQKALPNCKIEWDDPAKATEPQPAGTK